MNHNNHHYVVHRYKCRYLYFHYSSNHDQQILATHGFRSSFAKIQNVNNLNLEQKNGWFNPPRLTYIAGVPQGTRKGRLPVLSHIYFISIPNEFNPFPLISDRPANNSGTPLPSCLR